MQQDKDLLKSFLEDKSKYFNRYRIRKSKKKFREIVAPKPELKAIQKKILKVLEFYLDPLIHETSKGFRKGQSTITNAAPHLNKRLVVNVDIKDFFPSIPSAWTKNLINSLYNRKKIRSLRKEFPELTREAFYEILTLEDKLPQGSPCSPILANYYLSQTGFDTVMDSLLNWNYTRYADDLTFSTDDQWRKAEELLPFVYSQLKHRGLEASKKKTKVKSSDQQQTVTGVLVNHNETRIPKDLKRSIILTFKKEGLSDKTKGLLAYASSVNKKQHKELMKKIGENYESN